MASILAAEVQSTSETTAQLFAVLDPAALYDRPRQERRPLTSYPAHHTFDRLFVSGGDPAPGKQSADTPCGYSRDFSYGAHYVGNGAPQWTSRRFLRRSFRNWFRYNHPYVYAALRVIEN